MGHRAYIAYEREDSLFNVHYSHWGAHDLKLRNKITEQTPLGGDTEEPEYVTGFMKMLEDATPDDAEVGGYLTGPQPDTPVEPSPEYTGLTIEEVCKKADDVMIEALYIVTNDFNVRAFEPIRVRFDQDSHDGNVLYLEPRWVGEDPVSNEYDCGKARGIRQTLETFVDDGMITESEARDRFIAQILEDASESLSKQILAHSPALTDEYRDQYPCAFAKPTGRTRMMGEMRPTGYQDLESWELPTGFDLPEPV